MSEQDNPLDALQFVSNAIKLEPNKKYLLIIRGIMNQYTCHRMAVALREHGFDCLCLSFPEDTNVKVVEVPAND